MMTSKHPKPLPPKWAARFFRWFCNDHLSEAVLGDMLELYNRRFHSLGKRKANWLFVWNVIQFVQPFALRKKSSASHFNHLAMFQNNFKIAWRSMSRQKMYTAIKISGFAIGLATCIVISLFIRHELSYDSHYADGASIYRVYNENQGENEKWASFPANMAPILKKDYPEVEKSARLIPYNGWYNAGSNLMRREDKMESIYQEGFIYADAELIEILEIPFVHGDRKSALKKPNTLVISQRIAEKYFPGEDPTGKILILDEDKSVPYTVDGVMENFPATSHLQQNDILITLAGVEFWPGEQTSWCCWNYHVYIRLRQGASPRELENKMLKVRDTYYVGHLVKEGDPSATEVRKNHHFRLQPVSDIHMNREGIHDAILHGDIRYVLLFGGVAVFILLLACVNFINLSTARSANRAKEVGLRKVVGSLRIHLVRQFLTESVIYSFVSFFVAMIIVSIGMPWFNKLAAQTISVPWTSWWFLTTLTAGAIVIGVVAGIYPSFYLSGFKPVNVLKGSVSRGSKSSRLRSAMVIFQFTTSIILIIGTFVIYRQMDFILNAKLGFDKEQVVLIHGANTLDKQQKPFMDELEKIAGVESVSVSGYLPVPSKRDQNSFWREGRSKEDLPIGAQRWYVDEHYINTLGIQLLSGRNFDPQIASDSQAIIINQAMAKALNLKNPVGERVQNWESWEVIGVVEDFHFESMKGSIGPLGMVYGPWGDVVMVKVRTSNMQDMIGEISQLWKTIMPHQPIRYAFLDESYARTYDDVERTGYIFATMSILAIFVACLGLFALSAFMVEQRNKEISIRLVLGASVRSIFRLLTQNFVILVLISFGLAIPVAWYIMQKWLEDYEYKVEITWDVFVISGVIAVIIALVTVSYQSIRAALMNPARNLRSE